MANTSPYQTSKTVLTVLGAIQQMAAFSGVPAEINKDTTLNRKYNHYPEETPLGSLSVKYFGIGIGGCRNIDDTNISEPIHPSMKDMDLYTPIPFRCVPVDEDLTAIEREVYRMRVRQEIHGSEYFCYYLKKVIPVDSSIQLTQINPDTHTEEPYILSTGNLTPTPPAPETSGLVSGTAPEINVATTLSLPITGHEVVEAVSALYNGDLRRARISEVGLYTGEDRNLPAYDADNNSFNLTEAIYTQLAIKHCWNGDDFSNPETVSNKLVRLGNGHTLTLA